MAASDAAVATLPASSPLVSALHEGSASNMSSPLSDVEDKDGDDDLMEQLMRKNVTSIGHSERETPAQSEHDDSVADDDDESNLSEVDINDSEAETERLHDSPSKMKEFGGSTTPKADRAGKRFLNTRERDFQFSPSKLKQQTRAGGVSDQENDAASDSDKDQSDSDLSTPSGHSKDALGSPHDDKHNTTVDSGPVSADTSTTSSLDTRKRKRSPATETVEPDQPAKKRVGSVAPAADASDDLTIRRSTAEATPTNTHNGDQSEEDVPSGDHKNHQKTSAQDANGTVARQQPSPGRSKRSASRKEKQMRAGDDRDAEPATVSLHEIPAPTTEGELPTTEEHVEAEADVDVEPGDGDGDVECDQDAEALHKDEEEMERKKAAQEFILGLEKSFAEFRDQYYEERLRLLNEEEAMLMAPEPTHPDYLAMMRCVDARRDDKMRIIEAEYRLNQESLQRWAVAGRSQIMSQYYQDVRKTREQVLEELGDEWYRIQQQRRCHANKVADFTLRYPESRAKAVKQVTAYNKEVSVLSEIARHKGFPGAPRISGASFSEIQDDLNEIKQAKRESSHHAGAVSATFQDYGAIPNERILGPAGEEFLKQTPWANPNHPSHQQQSRPREQATAKEANGNSPHYQSGPSGGRNSHNTRRAQIGHGSSAINGTSAMSSSLLKSGMMAIK
ncbi:hypothetical protein PpBr36_00149 [Pyricularia pennisetigena]|uniref:hypothetical protein n=1 Tax=Pyricularia pennisetigena TaxID=1578925 RepID=UPI0011513134|nr:hypothetical protein PpBr36_00149 [Pyricularia pennisetigena]TLS29308.1 hypothetical protein PpBr36_00149 [Pyricularia pennisetigena]